VKKTSISKLFLYRYRFTIGYILLGSAFLILLFLLPLIAQTALSASEMKSAIASINLNLDSISNGNLVDLPYHLLQKLSITIFGFTTYSIKLPSILIGAVLAFILILLLNRWFKSNVSLLASALIILSTPFLFLAGSGTPLIMLVFWPTFLLWLGSKIQGEKKPKSSYCLAFAIALLASIFTPYMTYFAIFCVIFALWQPHLRFVIKRLPKIPLILTGLIIVAGFAALITNIINRPDIIKELLFSSDFELANLFKNIASGFAPVFSWRNSLENIFLSPLVSLPTFMLILIGLFSTTKGFFASRNSIASLLIIFAIIITGFSPESVIFIILPFAILTAHGIKYLLEKWYSLFPENPYARIFALVPLSILFGLMIIPSLSQYVYGYRYNPNVANEFSDTLNIINKNLTNETLYILEDYDFYKNLESSTELMVTSDLSTAIETNSIASLQKLETIPQNFQLSRIITSSKSNNSDIIYLYTKQGE